MKISKFYTIEYLEIFCNFVNIPEYLNLDSYSHTNNLQILISVR